MKKLIDILTTGAIALFALTAAGCRQDEDLAMPYDLRAESDLTFEAVGAEPQVLRIGSTTPWYIDTESIPNWIIVSPTEGTTSTDADIRVDDNLQLDGETIAAPRDGVINIISRITGTTISVEIHQKGDTYLGVSSYTISQVASLDDDARAKIPGVAVVARTNDGFVARDDTGLLYVTSSEEIAIGDKIDLFGEKSTLYGLPHLVAGQINPLGTETVTHPSPVDLLSNLDPARADKVTYVSVEAGLLGSNLYFFDSDPGVTVTLLGSPVVDLEAVNMHDIAIRAYFVGLENKTTVVLAVTECEDLGINENLDCYFFDDFSWMQPLIETSGVQVDDSIADNNASGAAPNLRTSGGLAPLLDEFLARGYQDLNPDAKVIYPQKYYWKFSKTNTETVNNNGGIILPHIEFAGSELVNAEMSFDWAAHMTGSGNVDKVDVVVELTGTGMFDNGTNVSDPFITEQTKGHLEWQKVENLLLRGVNNTTQITVRPLNYAELEPDQQCWYIDNIKIGKSDIPYAEPVYAALEVSEEVVTFEGAPDGPVSIDIASDYDWTITKPDEYTWFTVDTEAGVSGESVPVTVTCEPSTSANLRHGYFTIASADTRKKIHVVQSAAGGELDPLISIVESNYRTLLGEGEEFTVKVQSNVDDYTITTPDWIEQIEAVLPSALVQTRSHSFRAKPNTTEAERKGEIKFARGELEAVLKVTQGIFVARVDVASESVYESVSGLGETKAYNVDSSIDFTVTASESWVHPQQGSGTAGETVLNVVFDANTGAESRTAHLVFTNERYEFTKEVEIEQHPSGVIFADTFDWLKPLNDQYNLLNPTKPVADSVGDNDKNGNAPNVYTAAPYKTDFADLFKKAGYVDLNPSDQLIYAQDLYLKFSKTGGYNTALQLAAVPFPDSATDCTLTFDWCAHTQGSGAVDDTKLTIVIDGDGTFDNGTRYSDDLENTQGKDEMFWTHSSVHIKGATKNTKLTVVMYRVLDKETGAYDYKVSGAGRFHLDNIKIAK